LMNHPDPIICLAHPNGGKIQLLCTCYAKLNSLSFVAFAKDEEAE
jgi:hypothetical protein